MRIRPSAAVSPSKRDGWASSEVLDMADGYAYPQKLGAVVVRSICYAAAVFLFFPRRKTQRGRAEANPTKRFADITQTLFTLFTAQKIKQIHCGQELANLEDGVESFSRLRNLSNLQLIIIL